MSCGFVIFLEVFFLFLTDLVDYILWVFILKVETNCRIYLWECSAAVS